MLITIPQELIEHILVIAAKDGYPSTVSSLSQTCKHFYHFISDNRHLWRDLFLAVFDDPHQGELEGKFDWRKEFLNRMQAQRSFKRWTTSRATTKNKTNDGKDGKGKEIKNTKDAHEQEKRLLQSLRTLLKALLIENPPMAPDLSSSSSSTSSASSSDSDDFDNMMLFGAPLSDTHLAYPLLIVLHALASQRRARGIPSPSLQAEEKWGMQLLDSVKSATSGWAEGVLENGYPNVLKERLLTFDAWLHRRPKSRRRTSPHDIVSTTPPSLLSPSTNTDIVSDPDWELTETGRLFYKLVMLKGYLFDRPDGSAVRSNGISRRTLSEQKKTARALARRRVYDMRYLTGERLFGPYLPVGKTLKYGLPVPEPEKTQDMTGTTSNVVGVRCSATPAGDVTNGHSTTDDSSYYPSSSQSPASSSTTPSDDEGEGELDTFHTDVLHLITAGVHPHYLLHHHLFHHPLSDNEDVEDDVAHGGATNGGANGSQSQTPGTPTSPNGNNADDPRSDHFNGTGRIENTKHQPPIDPFVLAETAPHKVVPDYAFLSAARLLIEMNMKGAWGNLIGIGQPGGEDDEDAHDEDFDGSGTDYDDDDDDDDDDDEEVSEDSEESEANRSGHGAEEETAAIHTNEAPIATHDSSNLSSPAIMPRLHPVSSSSSSASSTLSSSLTSPSQLSSSQSSESPVTNNTSIRQNINNTGQEDGHDDGGDGNPHGNATNGEGAAASFMVNLNRDTRRWVERLVDAFSALDFVRMGGAVGYWRNVGLDVKDWRRGNKKGDAKERRDVKNKDKEEERLIGKGKGKARAKDNVEEYEGWDWAGVEGEWRRVVCWMDYQDLLLHSSGATRINETGEAIRLFPHKLHITGYSPPPAFPSSSSSLSTSSVDTVLCGDETTNPDALIWHLPVIHFAGESRLPESAHGNGQWNGQPGDFVRQITGTVRMIGDGAVRWTMTSSHVNQTEPEWAMEGVQVGCIGSAVGVLGMWTGADHFRGDPIGPCWQWKVS